MKVKHKLIWIVLGYILFVLCAYAEDDVLVIGATPVPHAEILEKAKVLLKAKGIDL